MIESITCNWYLRLICLFDLSGLNMKVFQVSFLLILAVAICFATDSTEESSASVQDDVAAQLDQELENLGKLQTLKFVDFHLLFSYK